MEPTRHKPQSPTIGDTDEPCDSNGTRVRHVPIFVESRGNSLGSTTLRQDSDRQEPSQFDFNEQQQQYDNRDRRNNNNRTDIFDHARLSNDLFKDLNRSTGIYQRDPGSHTYSTNSPGLQKSFTPSFDPSRRSDTAFTQYAQSPPSFFPRSDRQEEHLSRPMNSNRLAEQFRSEPFRSFSRDKDYRNPRQFEERSHSSTSSPGWNNGHNYRSEHEAERPQSNFSSRPKVSAKPNYPTHNKFSTSPRLPPEKRFYDPKPTLINVPSPAKENRDNITIVPINHERKDPLEEEGPPKVIPLYSPEPSEPKSPPPSTTPIPLPPPPSLIQESPRKESTTVILGPVAQKDGSIHSTDEALAVANPEEPIPMPSPVPLPMPSPTAAPSQAPLSSECEPVISPTKVKALEKHQNDDQNMEDALLEAIEEIRCEVDGFVNEINSFVGVSSKEKPYRYLDEMLTRCMLRLDNIECGQNDSIRQTRKLAIKKVNKAISLLEAKVEENATKSGKQNNKSPGQRNNYAK